MTEASYIPPITDILRSYNKTSGVCVSNFEINGKSYNFFDTGGRRTERRKLTDVLPNKDAVLFTIDVACYGEPLMESEESDAMEEQLMAWRGAVNSRGLSKSDVIVIFTKVDRLTGNVLAQFTTTTGFENYVWDSDSVTADDVLRYLSDRLMSMVMEPFADSQRKISFWHASIVESSTELANIALAALQ